MSNETTAPARHSVHHVVGGRTLRAGGETFPVHNPATGAVIARVPLGGVTEVDAAVAAAWEAFPGWATRQIRLGRYGSADTARQVRLGRYGSARRRP